MRMKMNAKAGMPVEGRAGARGARGAYVRGRARTHVRTRIRMLPFAIAALSVLFVACFVAGCTSGGEGGGQEGQDAQSGAQAASVSGTVTKHERYDSAITSLSAEDLAAAGFSFGDSCDVAFSNGFTVNDVPYFDGYYVRKGEPVVVAYPSDQYVCVARNNSGFWTSAGLSEGDTVTITVSDAGKYRSTYEALAQKYSTERTDYASDEQFSNFRALSGGKLKENFLYRGASPVDDSRKRAAVTDSLLERYGIVDVVDLADTQADMEGYFAAEGFSSAYTRGLYERGADVTLGMSSDYEADAYRTGVATGMRHLVEYGGPAYIHCMEGKDRTGFVCALVEALAGASYDEMRADYMTTYANYYGITAEGTPERYEAVASLYFDAFARYLLGQAEGGASFAEAGEAELAGASYEAGARSYLQGCGMSAEEIDRLVETITK